MLLATFHVLHRTVCSPLRIPPLTRDFSKSMLVQRNKPTSSTHSAKLEARIRELAQQEDSSFTGHDLDSFVSECSRLGTHTSPLICMPVNTAALLRKITFMPSNWAEFPVPLFLEHDEFNMCLVFKYRIYDYLVPATLLIGHSGFNRDEYFRGMVTKVTQEVRTLRDDPFKEPNYGGDY